MYVYDCRVRRTPDARMRTQIYCVGVKDVYKQCYSSSDHQEVRGGGDETGKFNYYVCIYNIHGLELSSCYVKPFISVLHLYPDLT